MTTRTRTAIARLFMTSRATEKLSLDASDLIADGPTRDAWERK
jgi:hypothetical protein